MSGSVEGITCSIITIFTLVLENSFASKTIALNLGKVEIKISSFASRKYLINLKNNLKFLILLIILALVAWFGVKMIVSKTSTASTTATTKKSSSLIQTNVGMGGGAGAPPADAGGPPLGVTMPSGGGAMPQ